jgi:ubiquinone/menaquinone biosynthesis C-methylase UbiE
VKIGFAVEGFGASARARWFSHFTLFTLHFSLFTLACALSPLSAQDPPKDGPPALTEYLGREIAQTMHYSGAGWLIRSEREREERCSLMLANLGARPGQTVCDMGCGNGFYTVKLGKMVGKNGKVLAVDIQPEMLAMLEEAAKKEKVENIEPILGELYDPKLPEGKVDLMLLVDVYHEFSHPQQMLAAMRRSLAPGGMVVLVEFRKEDPEVLAMIRQEHTMTKAQIMKEMGANGFKLVKKFEGLPMQHMLWFGRDDDATLKEIEP